MIEWRDKKGRLRLRLRRDRMLGQGVDELINLKVERLRSFSAEGAKAENNGEERKRDKTFGIYGI